jgi:hypothetical protein
VFCPCVYVYVGVGVFTLARTWSRISYVRFDAHQTWSWYTNAQYVVQVSYSPNAKLSEKKNNEYAEAKKEEGK